MRTIRRRDSREFFSELILHSIFPLAVFTPQGKYLFSTDTFCRLTGYSPEELRSLPTLSVLTSPAWKAAEVERRQKLLSDKSPVLYFKEIVGKDGHLIKIQTWDNCVYDDKGNIRFLYSLIVNIENESQRRKLQSAFVQHLIHPDRNESYDKLVSELGHDDLYVRLQAIAALGKSKNAKAAEHLIRLARDRSHDIRMTVALALGDLGVAGAADILIDLLGRDRSESVRWAAALALGGLPPSPSILEALEKAKTQSDSDVRQAAKNSLARLAPASPCP